MLDSEDSTATYTAASPSPDYVPGPEYLPAPEFIPEPVYPMLMPSEDEILAAEELPLPTVVSPTADSPGDDDDDEDESSDNDEDDDDVDIEEDEDEDEEEEHIAPADFIAVALPAFDHAPFAEEIEPFEIDESVATPPPYPAYCVTARMSIRPQTPISFPSDTEIAILMAIPTPPPSPLSLWLSRILPLLPIPLSTPSPPLLPPSTDPRLDVRVVCLPPRKRLCYTFGSRFKVESDVGYRIIDSWNEIVETIQGAPATDETKLGGSTTFKDRRVTGGRLQETGTVHRGTKTADETLDLDDRKIAPKRTTRANLATTKNTTTTTVTDAQLKALIEQGVNAAFAERDVDRNMNGDDSHVSGTGVRRTERVTRECTYPDFMKCQPLNFKGMEGVIELTQWFEKMETVFRISKCSV
nr:hypothetical protein [Tanacetum cinerariifolium]